MAALTGAVSLAAAQDEIAQQPKQDVSKLGIEDLMNIEVTTASKQAQSLARVPAAIFVVTQEDIHRSGATSIPEALRMVPGVQVARDSANLWLVSIRGFESRFADKLLVMVDGRSIYDLTFSGVFWDAPEVTMTDIDRIEVIRGPGGTLWGANAVNGIINIITKHASETQGTSAEISGATGDANSIAVENGGKLGPKAYYRVYAKYLDVASFDSTAGGSGSDGWQALHAGFRTDWATNSDVYVVSGGVNSSHQGQVSAFPTLVDPYSELVSDRFPTSNWDVLARWERTSGEAKGTSLQFSFDHSTRILPESTLRRDRLTLDFQQPLNLSNTNHVVWGVGFTMTRDDTPASRLVFLNPERRQDQVFSGFIQDELNLNPRLKLSLGTKLEHNSYSGWELQPSARLTLLNSSKQTFWAAVSRAVRTPNRLNSDVTALYAVLPPDENSPLPIEARLIGNRGFKSEEVVAQEIGWRFIPSDRLSVDITAYYNQYDNLFSLEQGIPFFEATPVPHMVLPLTYGNGTNARTAGLEIATQLQVNPNWRLKSALTIYSAKYFQDQSSNSSLKNSQEAPGTQFNVGSLLDLSRSVQLDTALYYVGRIGAAKVPAYCRVDVRLGWHPAPDTEISLGVQNLFSKSHREAVTSFIDVPAFVPRSVSLTATLRF